MFTSGECKVCFPLVFVSSTFASLNLKTYLIMEKSKMNLDSALKIISDFTCSNGNDAEREKLKKMLKGWDVSEVVDIMLRSENTYSRRILRFFRWFCKWMPIAIMLAHWYGLHDFSQHPREMFVADSENTVCYAWIYFMAYLLPMVIIAASRFFFLCWRYRIPFFYFFGVNALHLGYGSLFTTNEMVKPHYSLMIMTILLYMYGFGEMLLNTKAGKKLI